MRNFQLKDALVIIFCLSGAAFCLNMFRLDLFQSIASQNNRPVGTVTVRYNNVQRRLADRVLWSRLFTEAPVYLGDLIRVAQHSGATLDINDNGINLGENTLIRILLSRDGEGRIIIELDSGSMSIYSSPAAGAAAVGLALNVAGLTVIPQAGTVISASVEETGTAIQVNEGSATIIDPDGQRLFLDSGDFFALDADGVEQTAPPAMLAAAQPAEPEITALLPLPPPEAPPSPPAVAAPAPVTRPPPPPPAARPPISPPPAPPPVAAPAALLPVPQTRLPVSGHRINFQDLRTARRIDFSWLPVTGANAYILTLYHEGSGGERRQVKRTEPLFATEWVLDNLAFLDQGTFVWQVEAVNITSDGIIERRGIGSQNTFIIDIPLTGTIEIQDMEIIHAR